MVQDKTVIWATVGALVFLDSVALASLVQGSLPLNPIVALVAVIMGRQHLTLVFWLTLFGALALQVGLIFLFKRRSRLKVRGDKASRHTGSAVNSQALSQKAVAEKAKRLQVQSEVIGLPIGKAVNGGRWLYSSFEDVYRLYKVRCT